MYATTTASQESTTVAGEGQGPAPGAVVVLSGAVETAPPLCLTGVQTPDCEGSLQLGGLLLDYLRFTFPDEVGLSGVLELLGGEGWGELDRGALGYRRLFQRGHQRIYFEGNPGMGVHVELTGQGCREFEGHEQFPGWMEFLGSVLVAGGKFTRSDCAWDDRGGLLDLAEIERAGKAGEWTSRWNTCGTTWERDKRTGVEQQKVTFGRRGSNAYLRFYDKAAEQGAEGHWVRCELELRDERAHAAMQALLTEGPAYLGGVLRGYLEFKQPATATRLERCRPAEWWIRFLDHVEKARLWVAPVKRTLGRTLEWLQRLVAPSLAFVRLGMGLETIDELLDNGARRLQAWQVRLLLQGSG